MPVNRKEKSMLDQLKNFDADQMDVDELVSLTAYARQLRSEYEHLNLEIPDWLDDQARSLKLAIKARTQDLIAKRLKEVRSRLNSLKTTEERRADLRAEEDKLKQLQAV